MLLVAASAALGYSAYVHILVLQADFYSRSQKIMQCLIVWLLPLAGPLLVHWVHSSHRVPPRKADRAFVPQQGQEEDVRTLHRHVDDL